MSLTSTKFSDSSNEIFDQIDIKEKGTIFHILSTEILWYKSNYTPAWSFETPGAQNCLYFACARSRTLNRHTWICSSKIVLAHASCFHCLYKTFCMGNVERASFASTSNICTCKLFAWSKCFWTNRKWKGKHWLQQQHNKE